ncbi:MAG: PKD domain-containing protein, partial [Verrucomicrobiota bacterium]
YGSTIIQGAWDPATTNGPLAVRCAWLTNGATLTGFTLEGGATRAIGNTTTLQSGGGIWCSDWFVSSVIGCNVRRNAAAYAGGGVCGGALSNSVVSGNRSVYGGGFAYAAAYNSLVISNSADSQGGGAYTRYPVVNCTVVRNWSGFQGGGIADFSPSYEPAVRNCVVSGNESMTAFFNQDYYPAYSGKTLNSCVQYPVQSAQWGNINADPQFTDDFHLAVTSPCRGAGSFLYAGGTDLDGEPWSNPPSMGCDEVDEAAITGPLSVTFSNWFGISEAVAGKMMGLNGFVTGRATRVGWEFGDGSSITNVSTLGLLHTWTNAGDYNVTFTAFNADHPNGVSANAVVHVVPLVAPSLGFGIAESSANLTFSTQPGLTYVLESTTNLAPAVWQSRGYYFATNNAMEIQSPLTIDPTVFFRIRVY